MRVVSLGSGSSGNAYLVEAGALRRTKLLIDAGLSARTITTRLASVGVLPSQVQGILVTHEHSDHVQGIPQLVKQYSIPVIALAKTLSAVEDGIRTGFWRSDSGRRISTHRSTNEQLMQQSMSALFTSGMLESSIPDQLTQLARTPLAEVINATGTSSSAASSPLFPSMTLPAMGQMQVGDIEISAFAVSHDAVDPCGYLLQASGCRLCLITDSGEVTDQMLEYVQRADLLILESNHDRERLLKGPYPWYLKRRILSPTGHLSNEQAAQAVLNTWQENGLRWLWLAHLSRTNNTPGLALESMLAYLRGAHVNLRHIRIATLPPTPGPVWDSTQLWS